MTISLIRATVVWDTFLVWLRPISTRIMHSRLIWGTWRLLPASIGLAAYDKLRRRHLSTTTGRVTKLPCELGLKTAHEYFPRAEADNTRFVAKHTSIPVPRILDVVESAEKTSDGRPMRAYILMTWLLWCKALSHHYFCTVAKIVLPPRLTLGQGRRLTQIGGGWRNRRTP